MDLVGFGISVIVIGFLNPINLIGGIWLGRSITNESKIYTSAFLLAFISFCTNFVSPNFHLRAGYYFLAHIVSAMLIMTTTFYLKKGNNRRRKLALIAVVPSVWLIMLLMELSYG